MSWSYERVYVIECFKHRFYVGSTLREMHVRLQEHKDGYGSRWTGRYGVKRLICCKLVEPGTSGTLEDELTKFLMRKYGWGQVRGGRWVFLQCKSKQWLPAEFRDLGATDVLPLHARPVGKFPAELRRLVNAFEMVCGFENPNHLNANVQPEPVLGGGSDHLHHVFAR